MSVFGRRNFSQCDNVITTLAYNISAKCQQNQARVSKSISPTNRKSARAADEIRHKQAIKIKADDSYTASLPQTDLSAVVGQKALGYYGYIKRLGRLVGKREREILSQTG